MKKQTINIVTLGCSKNKVDSEHLAGKINPKHYRIVHDGTQLSNIVIVNTCGFIGDAKEESIDTILSFAAARKSNQIDKLIVMGCLSERYASDLQKEFHEVDAFFGVNDIHRIADLLGSESSGFNQTNQYNRVLSTGPHFAYLKISEGCDRNCSFCAIPLIRGKHISKPEQDLIREATYLASIGVKELVLIAQDLTYYGIDLHGKRTITSLITGLSGIEGIEWIRLQYAYPHAFPMDLLTLMQSNSKVCKYIDLPLQHINSRILKSMKRSIDKQQTIDLVNVIRESVPGIAFRSTLIVGYPGETESEFLELVEFVKLMQFERLGVFTYSHEEDTPAFELIDDVPEKVKQERLSIIMDIQQEISFMKNKSRIGCIEKVIIDRDETDYFVGRTQFDSPEVDNEVLIKKENFSLKVGDFYNMRIIDADYFDLFATPIA